VVVVVVRHLGVPGGVEVPALVGPVVEGVVAVLDRLHLLTDSPAARGLRPAGALPGARRLAHAVFHGPHPHGVNEVLCTVLGIVGAAILLVAALMLLWPRELGFSVNARAMYRELWNQQILEQPLVDLTLADAFHDQRQTNRAVVTRLTNLLALAVIALAFEAAGFAAAATLGS
jgi:chromate transport protein ChrA